MKQFKSCLEEVGLYCRGVDDINYGELPLEPHYQATVQLEMESVKLTELQIGQTLETGHALDSPLALHLSNGEQYQVKLGAKDGVKAIQIVE